MVKIKAFHENMSLQEFRGKAEENTSHIFWVNQIRVSMLTNTIEEVFSLHSLDVLLEFDVQWAVAIGHCPNLHRRIDAKVFHQGFRILEISPDRWSRIRDLILPRNLELRNTRIRIQDVTDQLVKLRKPTQLRSNKSNRVKNVSVITTYW